jgi:hypothetical protein
LAEKIIHQMTPALKKNGVSRLHRYATWAVSADPPEASVKQET